MMNRLPAFLMCRPYKMEMRFNAFDKESYSRIVFKTFTIGQGPSIRHSPARHYHSLYAAPLQATAVACFVERPLYNTNNAGITTSAPQEF
jgi:hypothetical protein